MGVKVSDIDRRYEAQLDGFNEITADRTIFDLGSPSSKLRQAGISDKPIRLYGSKLLKKMRLHGFGKKEVRGLSKSLRNPIAVFNTHGKADSFAVLTELKTKDGNLLIALELGKGKTDADLIMVSSIYGKNENNVIRWINGNKMRWVDKKKALKYLHLDAPIAPASNTQELYDAANIINNFRNKEISAKILVVG